MAETSRRGFASMDAAKQREIASKGGRAAHQKGTAHEFTSDEARNAGRKGGESVSRNREHMSAIGRRGGEQRGANRAAAASVSENRQDIASTVSAFGSNSSEASNRLPATREQTTNTIPSPTRSPFRTDEVTQNEDDRSRRF